MAGLANLVYALILYFESCLSYVDIENLVVVPTGLWDKVYLKRSIM